MPLATLLEFYRQQILQFSWEVGHEEVTENLAVLAWSFRNTEGQEQYGILTIVPAGERVRLVRLAIDTLLGP